MTKTFLFALLMTSSVCPALAVEPNLPHRGFLVFSAHGVANYVREHKGRLQLKGELPSGGIEEFAASGSRLYRMNSLLGTITELGDDLKPVHEISIKSKTVPDWLGSWNGGLLVLDDNSVVYLDGSLKEVARLPLQPHGNEQITPALAPAAFSVWKNNGYLLANTGEVFVIPQDRPTLAEPISAAIRTGEQFPPEALWIDPADQTLNLLVKTQKEEYGGGIKPGERRVTKEEVVLTYDLKDPGGGALRTVVHEEREIHDPIDLNFSDGDGREGLVIERMPNYRAEGPAKGTHIGVMSRTTPAYAEVFEEKTGQPMPRLEIVRLKSRGRYEIQTLSRTAQGSILRLQKPGERLYFESDLKEHVLRLQPEPYGELLALPELRGIYFKALAY